MHIHDEERQPLVPYIIASIAVHLLILALIPISISAPEFKEKIVQVFPLLETQKSEPHEIADIAKPAVEKRPDKARFMGMYDSSVEQETVSVTKKQGSKEAGGQRSKEAGRQGSREIGRPAIGKKGHLYNVDRNLFAMKTPDIESKKGSGFSPGSEMREDFYPDYKLGQHTYLNVLKYPDVEYFVRMKRQFKMTFNPVPALREYFTSNRVTRGSVDVVLAVSVNRDGNLSELFVINSSGIPSYDQEAMRTVKASSPFAGPPEKFLENDGLLRMSWTFTVYL